MVKIASGGVVAPSDARGLAGSGLCSEGRADMGQVRLVLLWLLCLGTNALGTHPAFAADTVPGPATELVVEYTRAVDEARRKHGDAARLALEKWNARLDELIGVAKSKGNLDAVLALQAERDGAERSVARGPVKVPPEASAARKTHDETVRKAEQEFLRVVDAAHVKLLSELEGLEKSETQANRIESALAVREFRVAREQEGPPELADRRATQDGPGAFPDWNGAWNEAARLVRQTAIDGGDRPLAVVWLVDASISLDEWRKNLADGAGHFESEIVANRGEALRKVAWGAASFGQGFATPLFPPREEAGLAAEAVRGIVADPSGKENLCAAVIALCGKIAGWRQEQQVVVVIVTDERGDDLKSLEDAIKASRNAGVTLFAISAESPFGVAKGRLPWKYPDGHVEWLIVDSGPETALPELAPVPTWTSAAGTATVETDWTPSSGFGPYSLGRLCEATGGKCLAIQTRMPVEWHPRADAMARYRPDYRSLPECEGDRKSNKAKGVVSQLALEWTLKPPPMPPVVFSSDRGGTKASRARALRDADEWLRRLDRLLAQFREAEPDRKTLREPRARAAFDLHRGRLLVLRARTVEYRRVLTESLTNAALAKTPALRMSPVKADGASDDARTSRQVLEKVVSEHPGTPWARLAERSLAEDLGWKLESVSQ
jgi:hypothetical protein